MTKLLRTYISNSYAVDAMFRHVLPADRTFTMEENIQYALGDVLQKAGRQLQRHAVRHESMPIGETIEVEVRQQGWDLEVRVHFEEGEKENVVSRELPGA